MQHLFNDDHIKQEKFTIKSYGVLIEQIHTHFRQGASEDALPFNQKRKNFKQITHSPDFEVQIVQCNTGCIIKTVLLCKAKEYNPNSTTYAGLQRISKKANYALFVF